MSISGMSGRAKATITTCGRRAWPRCSGARTAWRSRTSRADLGSLIEAVNFVGSLFYGTLLGCFVLALGFRRVGGTAASSGMLVGEAAILATWWFTNMAWLWYNVIGAVVVVATALVITAASSGSTAATRSTR